MKKPLNVLSKTALAAVFASSAIIPTAVQAAETPVEYTLNEVVLEKSDKLYVAELPDYLEANTEGFEMFPAYVKAGDKYYKMANYVEAAVEVNNNMTEAASMLNKYYDPVELEFNGVLDVNEDGWYFKDHDEQPEDRLNETFFYNFAA